MRMLRGTDLTMTRGEAARWVFPLVDRITGDPLVLADITATFAAKSRVSDAVPVFAKTIGSGITVDGSGLVVQLSAADTAGLDVPVSLWWELELADATGPQNPDHGRLYVRRDIVT